MAAQQDRTPPGTRPWYLSRDLAGLGVVSVLAVLAIAVLIFIRNPASAPARVVPAPPVPVETTAAPAVLRPPPDAAVRSPLAAAHATGVTVGVVRLAVRGGVAVITGMTPDGTAVGRLDAGGVSRAVRWDVSRPSGGVAAQSADLVELPRAVMIGDNPTISTDGVVSYTTVVKNLPVGRPVALVRGRLRAAPGVAHGGVVNSNAQGQVLLNQLDLPFANGTGFSGMGVHGTGYVWTPSTGALRRVGELGSRLLGDGSVLVLHPGLMQGETRANLLWHDAAMTTLPEPTGWTAQVFSGSGWRAVAGTLIRGVNGDPQTDPSHPALWHYGQLELLPGLGGRAGVAGAVNPAGVVAGAAEVPAGQPHAMRWIGGRGTDLGTLGGDRSWATSVGDSGLVAGWASTSTGVQHAAAWLPDGRIVDLGAELGAKTQSSANGVSGNRIYGSRTGAGGVQIPVVWNLAGL